MLKLKKILLVLILLMVLLFVKQPTVVEATEPEDFVTIEYHITPRGWWNEGVRLTITNLDYSGTAISIQYTIGDWWEEAMSDLEGATFNIKVIITDINNSKYERTLYVYVCPDEGSYFSFQELTIYETY